MNPIPESDDLLHRALADIGPALPEPTAPAAARRHVASMRDAPEPVRVSRRVGAGALAAAGVALLVLSGVMLIQNQRLRAELDRARAAGANGAVVPAGRDLPPLVAVRFYHPQCDVAKAVAPRFDEIERAHPSDQVLFVSLDLSESRESEKLACALDCDFVLSCDGQPVRSGMVVLADTRSKRIIKASHDTSDIGELESALDQALVACEREPRGD